MTTALVLLSVLFVAYTNGANDNFKGVATLFGSGTTDYKRALGWGTVTTLAGSITALLLSGQLVKTFRKVVASIVLAWVITLPVATVLSALVAFVLTR